MYWDYQNEFSSVQAVTVSGSSTNVIDIGKNAGAGEPIGVHAFVDGTDFTGDTYLTIQLVDGAVVDFISAASQVLWSSRVYHYASLTDGFVFNLPNVPAEHRRFLRLGYVAQSTFTAGAISACLMLDKQSNKEKMGQA